MNWDAVFSSTGKRPCVEDKRETKSKVTFYAVASGSCSKIDMGFVTFLGHLMFCGINFDAF